MSAAARRRLAGPAAAIGGAQAVAALAVFVLGIVTFRSLGPDGRGVFAVATLAATLGGVLAYGHYIPLARVAAEGRSVARALGGTWPLVPAGVATAAVLLVASGDTDPAHAALAGLYVVQAWVAAAFVAVTMGEDRTRALSVSFAAGSCAQLAGASVALLAGAGATGTLAGWVLGHTLFTLALVPAVLATRSAAAPIRGALRGGATVGVSGLLAQASRRIELIVLAALATSAEAGRYSVAVSVAAATAIATQSVATAAFHRLGPGQADPRRALARVAGVAVVVAMAVSLVAGVLGVLLVPVLYGPQADGLAVPLAVLLTASVVAAPLPAVLTHLVSFGRATLVPPAGAAVAIVVTCATMLAARTPDVTTAALASLAGVSASAALQLSAVGLLFRRDRRRERALHRAGPDRAPARSR